MALLGCSVFFFSFFCFFCFSFFWSKLYPHAQYCWLKFCATASSTCLIIHYLSLCSQDCTLLRNMIYHHGSGTPFHNKMSISYRRRNASMEMIGNFSARNRHACILSIMIDFPLSEWEGYILVSWFANILDNG